MKKLLFITIVLFLMTLSPVFAYVYHQPPVQTTIYMPGYSYTQSYGTEQVRLHPIYVSQDNYVYAYTHQPIRRSYTPPSPQPRYLQGEDWRGYTTQYFHPFYSRDYSRWDNY